jgi:purine catabolism regulator
MHRNSVRRQIKAIAELLDMDLGQAQSRAELWIALQYQEFQPGNAQESQER